MKPEKKNEDNDRKKGGVFRANRYFPRRLGGGIFLASNLEEGIRDPREFSPKGKLQGKNSDTLETSAASTPGEKRE